MMYHFRFIEETSMESGSEKPDKQEANNPHNLPKAESNQNLLYKTAQFLHKHLNQPSCFRIYISKN